eukprot:GILI01026966.1.p1 GENE.GILI01026966.1~~GILI01026966.1.p1  ORF type:complete len:170 (-),score=14.29 GILI01026966.1:24-533(-)
MNFQSPTTQVATIPSDERFCQTPEQCVLYALSSAVKKRNNALKQATKKAFKHKNRKTRSVQNEIFTLKDIETAVKNYFPKKNGAEEWISIAIQSLLARGALININSSYENMAPAFQLNAISQAPVTSNETKKKAVSAGKIDANNARKTSVVDRKLKKLKSVNKLIRKRK